MHIITISSVERAEVCCGVALSLLHTPLVVVCSNTFEEISVIVL